MTGNGARAREGRAGRDGRVGKVGRLADLGAMGTKADHFAEDLFDELLPPSLDWRHLVQRYPHVCVAAVAAAGFWVGRRKSGLIMAALTSYVAAQFGDAIADLGEGDPSTRGH